MFSGHGAVLSTGSRNPNPLALKCGLPLNRICSKGILEGVTTACQYHSLRTCNPELYVPIPVLNPDS